MHSTNWHSYPAGNPAKALAVVVAAALLVAAALSKLYTSLGDLPMLELFDPVLLVKNRYLLIGVGLLEIGIAAVLLVSKQWWFKGILLLWLSVNFVLYRLAFFLSGAGEPCPCLGNVVSKLGLAPAQAEFLLKAAVAYLFITGGYLVWKSGLVLWKLQTDSALEEPPPGRVADVLATPSNEKGS